MVIHDRSYKRWDGDRDGRVPGVRVLFERGLATTVATLFKRKFFAQVLSLWAYGPFLFALGFMYLLYFFAANTAQFGAELEELRGGAQLVTPNPDTVWGYLLQIQAPIALLLCVLVGSGLVAEDRRTNALELYLSRPVSVLQYVVGKLAVVTFFLALVTVVPACFLIVAQIFFGGAQEGRAAELLDLLWRTALAGSLGAGFLGLVALTASSLANRARNAAILLFGFGIGLEGIIVNLLRENFREPALNLVSLGWDLGQVLAYVLGNQEELDARVPVLHAAAVLVGFTVLCALVIRRQVRPVEIVA